MEMSQEESNPLPTPHSNQKPGTSMRRLIVEFNENGKAIGPYAAKYASKVGNMTRQHCPPIYSQWREVLAGNNDDTLKGVVANKLWKNWKTIFRGNTNNYETVQEKKAHPKKGIKQEARKIENSLLSWN